MTIIETVRYKVKDGVSRDQALEAWEDSQSFALSQKGFIRRKLAVTENGEFIDHVEWASMEDAKAAAANFDPSKHPELLGLVQVLDESSMVMTHYEILGEFEA